MKRALLGAACAAILIAASGAAHAASVTGQGTWESTLQGRDLDGNLTTAEAYYDTMLDITWLANANYAGTPMNWSAANTWAANLDPYGSGITGWRLPTITDTGTSGCNFSTADTDCGYNVDTATGEMAHMFYSTLGDLAYYDTSGVSPQPGWGLTNTGPFSSVLFGLYWSATEYAPSTSQAWYFYTYDGGQYYFSKSDSLYAWAVHNGDVGIDCTTYNCVSTTSAPPPSIPVPPAVWLFGSGLFGLVSIIGKRRH